MRWLRYWLERLVGRRGASVCAVCLHRVAATHPVPPGVKTPSQLLDTCDGCGARAYPWAMDPVTGKRHRYLRVDRYGIGHYRMLTPCPACSQVNYDGRCHLWEGVEL